MKHKEIKTMIALALLGSASAFAQQERSSSSMYLPAWKKADVTVPFAFSAEGKRFEPTWGLDMAWISTQNIMKGINHMGKENIGIGRTAFRFTSALTNDSVLVAEQINVMRQRAQAFDKVSATLPLTFTADQEAGTNEYYVKNKAADINHWAAMINSHVHWMQANTKHPIVGISPFNEGDYWSVEEGGTPTKQWQVAKMLKENYPRCKDIAMVGGNTLNNDKALSWYTTGKQYYDWGNTHQLAGSFDTFAAFFEQLAKDGKVGYADEMHNVGEAMIGLEYGMTVGIWWGFDSRARGEFCQISRHGERLAYAEHRNNWTAASVYRHDDGRVKAFVGSSERQATTTNYLFVSPERDVYYDGYGPVREYFSEMPGGTAYQTGQTNAERVIDVTWGESVPPVAINGTYKIINKVSGATGNVVAYSTNLGSIIQQAYKGTTKQQWTVKPVTNRSGGDLSFYDIESVSNAKVRMNVKDYATSQGDIIAYTQDLPSSNEQWYLEYVGDSYYYIRNRESALYLASAGTSVAARLIQTPKLTGTNHDRMLFRFVPVDVQYETEAPSKPEGLVAEPQMSSVKLTWTGNSESDLNGYIVLRADQSTQQWNTITRMLQTTSFVDNTALPGTIYIYKVEAIDKSGNISEASEPAEAQPTGAKGLLAQWKFNKNLFDETPNMMDAALYGTSIFENGHAEGSTAFRLAGPSYIQLPYEVANHDEMTIALWVKWTTNSNWQRIFDFGNGTENYMFLTPANSYTNVMRFAIKNGGDEQDVDCKQKLSLNVWKHIAVVIGKEKTCIYIDGEEAASSTGITIRPSDIHPVLNYVGRSQFAADPMFRGVIDDMRIYNYALAADDVKKVMEGQDITSVQQPSAEPNTSAKAIYGLDGRRYDSKPKGLFIIDGKKQIEH